MAMLPKLKLKAMVSFPSNVYGGTGIEVSKTNGNFTINLDYSEFPTTGTLPPNTNALVWDPVTNTYYLVPPSAVGGISDAPSDSKMYGRYNHAWVDAWASPILTGNPTAPTPAPGDNDTSVATTAFVTAALTGSVAGVASIGSKSGVITLNGGSMATNELPAPRYDVAQTLTSETAPYGTTVTQRSQARSNIYSAPFDALAYSGMQINGSMEVSQERGTTPINGNGFSICDGWKQSYAGTMSLTGTGGPLSNYVPGFGGLLYMQVPTPQVSLGASDYAMIYQVIEGWRVARLAWGTANAQPITLGFWTAHGKIGLYSGTIRNGANNRSYAFTYTQAVSAIAQYNTVTIPGDTTGTWAVDNTAGMQIVFALASGTGFTATSANTWLASGYVAAPGQVNSIDSSSNVFRITGVVVLPGIEAPSAARSSLIMRPLDQELMTCQRYWQKSYNYTVAPGAASSFLGVYSGIAHNSTAIMANIVFKTRMRITPTVVLYSYNGTSGASSAATGNADTAAASVSGVGENAAAYVSSSSLTIGASYFGHYTADARL